METYTFFIKGGFREALRDVMAYQDITVKELSAKSGVAINTINSYLKKGYREPSLAIGLALISALGDKDAAALISTWLQGDPPDLPPVY